MIYVLGTVFVLVVLLVRRRRYRKSVLAGLVSDRPAYSLAPPTRWSTSLRDHRL